MYETTIEVKFDAAHRLLNYEGKCHGFHGHTYAAIVCVASEKLADPGFVIDFGELKRIVKGWVDAHWDHATILNKADKLVLALMELKQGEVREVLKLPEADRHRRQAQADTTVFLMDGDPTAERMAKLLFDVVADVFSDSVERFRLTVEYVTIKETATSWATYRRGA